MTVLASSIAANTRFLTLDSAGVRWTDAELLAWINEAQVQVVTHKPTASVTNGAIGLVAGVRQSLPAIGLSLLGVTHNTATGATCTLVQRNDLEASAPGWTAATAEADAQHYMVDEDDPKSFLVYPPNDGTGDLTARYASLPTPVAAIGSAITLPDEYAPIIEDYVLYRIWMKHTNVPNNVSRAKDALEKFLRALGVKIQTPIIYSPKRDLEEDANRG